MRTPHRFRTIASTAAVAVLVAITLNPTMVSAQDTGAAERGCAREFDAAVAQYVRTTDERDADGFNALLHKEVTVIFRLGEILSGRAAVERFIDEFFADPAWTQTFTVLRSVMSRCDTGFVLFDSTYTDPSTTLHLIIGVTFVREHGRWLVLHNQDSGTKL